MMSAKDHVIYDIYITQRPLSISNTHYLNFLKFQIKSRVYDKYLKY